MKRCNHSQQHLSKMHNNSSNKIHSTLTTYSMAYLVVAVECQVLNLATDPRSSIFSNRLLMVCLNQIHSSQDNQGNNLQIHLMQF